jgi:EAL domain-containing protein (putative c-di-GMP-specific phosphodiesterase class I)
VNDVARNNIRRLYEMGFSFSLDDYGTGYSNIQRLSKLPLSIIKIDKTMVDEMFSRKGRVIIQNTIRMMQGIDKSIVMEGVETREELEGLREMACDYIQGYYFSKPLSASDFEKFLRSKQPA